MQFACESCQATLHIADERLKGKRLVVRCKRCNSRIQIADPALGPGAAASSAAPRSEPVARVNGAAAAQSGAAADESTRAMDSEELERALEASRDPGDEGAAVEPPPERVAPWVPSGFRQGPPWFAMVSSTQLGPLSPDEVERKVAEGAIGPRTYVWREGMTGWERGKDVREIAALLGLKPPAAARPARPVAAPSRSSPSQPGAARSAPTGSGAAPTSAAADLARWASSEISRKPEVSGRTAAESPPTRPPASAAPSSRSAPLKLRGPAKGRRVALVALFLVAAAGIALGTALWRRRVQSPAASPVVRKAPPHAAPAAPAAAHPPAPAARTGLSAQEVKRKLDENKGALQACVDEALSKEPGLRVGRIQVATTIAPSGTVTEARIDRKAVDESSLGGCLKRATRSIVFPAFAGEPFEVDIPIVVNAGK